MMRAQVDTVGFVKDNVQMEIFLRRITELQGKELVLTEKSAGITEKTAWKVAISPHDDYAYVGYLYPALLRHVKAKKLIIFGVAHKARKLNLQNRIIFDSYTTWHGIDRPIPVSSLRENIKKYLPESSYIVHDEMQSIEHSVEALLPFLQYYNPSVEIVSILAPYMSYERILEISQTLADAIYACTIEKGLQWGRDFAILISSDAVHYGDRKWGGRNFAYYGTDEAGYQKALDHEKEIIENLTGVIEPRKLKRFMQYTLEDDYVTYKWTWCGRFSIPLGLMTAYFLQDRAGLSLKGRLVGYHTSIDQKPIALEDLGMGVTAPANDHHWVGYAALGFE